MERFCVGVKRDTSAASANRHLSLISGCLQRSFVVSRALQAQRIVETGRRIGRGERQDDGPLLRGGRVMGPFHQESGQHTTDVQTGRIKIQGGAQIFFGSGVRAVGKAGFAQGKAGFEVAWGPLDQFSQRLDGHAGFACG